MEKVIYSAAPTPFTLSGELDIPAFERMIESSINSGITGFFLSGNMGEWSQYDLSVRRQLAEHGMAAAAGRAKILMGVTETGLHKTITTMRALAEFKPDAYVVMLPARAFFQFPAVDYVRAVLDAADRPVYYYHCPPANGISLGNGELEAIVSHPNLEGVKNSAGDVGVRRELLRLRRRYNFVLLEGHEWAIDEAVILGCDGALCGMACLAGRLMCRIAGLAEAGDFAAAMDEQNKLIDIFHGIYGAEVNQVQSALKYAMTRLGIFNNYHCLLKDDRELGEADKRRVDECLERYRGEW